MSDNKDWAYKLAQEMIELEYKNNRTRTWEVDELALMMRSAARKSGGVSESSIARMAGNIASGIVGHFITYKVNGMEVKHVEMTPLAKDQIAEISVDIAMRIHAVVKEQV